jgi:hypothetical protein
MKLRWMAILVAGCIVYGYATGILPLAHAASPKVSLTPVQLYDAAGDPLGTLDNPLASTAVVSGTFNLAASVDQGTAGASAWLVDLGSTTVPLPTGASTSAKQDTEHTDLAAILAKQPSLGTAGSASSNVITVQGIASMTPFHVILDSGAYINPSVSATGTGVPADTTYIGVNVGGNMTGVTGATRGSEKALSVQIVDASGAQVTTFGGAGGTSSDFGSAFPSAGTAIGASDGVNMQPLLVDASGFLLTSLGTTLQAAASLGLAYDTITGYCGVTTSKPTYSTGTNDPLSCTTTGALRTDLLSIDGVALLMGAGNTGTGSLRVTLASDNAPLTIRGANSNQAVYSTAGAYVNMTTATTTQIVALSGSTVTYVTGYSIVGAGATATNVKFVGGTGSNCGTGGHDLTSSIPLTATTNTVGVTHGSTGPGVLFKNAAGEEICVTSSGAATIGVDVSYAQF